MSNKSLSPVSYQKFKANAVLGEGLLGVARDDAGVERRVASALFRIAGVAGQIADDDAVFRGQRDGGQAGLAGAPGAAEISGGDDGSYVPGSGGIPGAGRTAPASAGRRTPANAERMVAYLVEKHGKSRVQAGGIVGRLIQESSLNVDAVGDNGTAFGLAQWRGDRLTGLKRFGGANWKDPFVQLDYLVHEMGTTERTAGDMLARARTVDEAAAAMMTFERPAGWTAANPRGGHGWDNTLAHAMRLAGTAAEPPGPVAQGTPAALRAPGVSPVTVKAGAGGGFRPTGRNTLYGRAYDAEGTKTYLSMLDATMRADMMEVYQRSKDDPLALQANLDALKVLHLDPEQGHVFEEIRADYETAFQRIAQPLLQQAMNNAETRRQDGNRAAFVERLTDLETQAARMAAEIGPDNPFSADALAGAQEAVDRHYDDAVAHGLYSADDAAKAKIASRNETALRFYGRQAESLDANGIKTLRETMRADFANGDMPGLTAEGWESLDASLQAMERSKRSGVETGKTAMRERAARILSRVAAGFDVDPADLAQLQIERGSVPGGADIADRTTEALAAARAIRDLPLPEATAKVAAMRDKLGKNPSDAAIAGVETAEKLLADKRKKLATDPVSYAEAAGVIDQTGQLADVSTPDDMAALIGRRIKAAEQIAQAYGVPGRFFKAGETAVIRTMVRTDPENAALMAGAIVDAAGEQATAVLRELGPEAPEMLGAGAILAAGGSPQAATDVLAGNNRDEAGNAYPSVPKTVRVPVEGQTIGAALALQPGDRQRIEGAAHAIARKRIAEAGLDPKDEDAQPIIERAINEAAGAVYDGDVRWGGFQRFNPWGWRGEYTVIVPSSIRADVFDQVIASIRPADFDGMARVPVDRMNRPIKAGVLAQHIPVATANGYAFARNDPNGGDPQFLRDNRGDVFVLDVEALAPRLAARVPGAFRGY